MTNQIISSMSTRQKACDELGVGETWLSVKTIDGCPYLIDQDGKMVNGIRSVSVSSEVKDITIGTVSFISKVND